MTEPGISSHFNSLLYISSVLPLCVHLASMNIVSQPGLIRESCLRRAMIWGQNPDQVGVSCWVNSLLGNSRCSFIKNDGDTRLTAVFDFLGWPLFSQLDGHIFKSRLSSHFQCKVSLDCDTSKESYYCNSAVIFSFQNEMVWLRKTNTTINVSVSN